MPIRNVIRLASVVFAASLAAANAQGMLRAPTPPAPKADADLVGLIIENLAAKPLPASPLTFGQAFLPGRMPAKAGMVARIDGKDVPVQVDAKTTYADGSLRMAVLSLIAPPLPAHAKAPVMLARAAAPASGNVVDPARLADGKTYDLSIDLAFHQEDGTTTPFHLDAAPLLAKALAAEKPDDWLRGPIAREIRVDAPVTGSFHVIFDVRAYADGTTHTDLQFANDYAMQKTGGVVKYDVVVKDGGKIALQYRNLVQFQYENWHRALWSGPVPPINLVRDVDYLERIGVIADYDLAVGAPAAMMAEETKQMASPGFGAPLATNGVTQYMPMTGARPDIGPTTRANAIWLLTQDPAAAAYALWQGEAAAGIPWHFRNPEAKTWLNTDQNPQIWTDPRGGANGLTQQVDGKNNGWAPDTAHQPDLSFVPYLFTGSRFHLDELNAQAAFSIVSTWPAMRGGAPDSTGPDNVIFGNQMRGGAWSLREIDEAAWANPDGSVEKKYFSRVMDDNWRWLAGQIPTLTEMEGEAHGYVIATFQYGYALAPWQQDYFSSAAAQAAKLGNADAGKFLAWSANFLAGSVLTLKHDSVNYVIAVFPRSVGDNGQIAWDRTKNGWAYAQPLKTWPEIMENTKRYGPSNGSGWARSDGDYGQLAMLALAGILSVVPSEPAREAYEWLQKSGAPYTDANSLHHTPEFDIVPRLPHA